MPRAAWGGAPNEPLRLTLPAEPDPTSLTPRSVALRDADGRALAWRATVRGRELRLEVVLGAAELAAAPRGWTLRLQGFPSPHALRWSGGGQLDASWDTELHPAPALDPGPGATPRVLRVNGAAPAAELTLPRGAPLELLLEGVFAPADLRAQQFPLHPVRGGLTLDPLSAAPSATVIGTRTELRLELPADGDTLLLRTRDWDCRDVSGRRLDPSVVIRVSRH